MDSCAVYIEGIFFSNVFVGDLFERFVRLRTYASNGASGAVSVGFDGYVNPHVRCMNTY